jgi:hypothetical protein
MKHHFSALINFHDAETPLFSTLDLHVVETPPFNTLDFLLLANHHCQQTTSFPPLLKHQTHTFFPHLSSTTFLPLPHHHSSMKQLHPAIVSPFPF